MGPTLTQTQGMLSVQNLSVAYGQSQVLSNVDLQVPAGQVVSLMGRNGVGKSTLLKSLMGLMPSRAGRIEFAGADVTRRPPHERARAGIGYVPQGRGIFPYLTVHENLLMGLEAAPRSRWTRAAVDEQYAQFPALYTYRTKVAGTLSGGQQQQLAFARALVRTPTLLLLDEPTEGIQPSIVDEIEQLILRLREGHTMAILLVEQFLDFALNVSDYCYVMEKGSIVAQGPTGELDQDTVRDYLAL
jgi:urea transport system ATP-binding protein